ncbi:MAG TPA: efflux RND transporter periplasmic adaptor subunit, partial [Flavilitoribacter sp.]|nr:efflux RND transporter periplasmic adaptor subunit [Flavilitoribacter sp.]
MIKYHLLIAVLVLILPACSEKKPETMPETDGAAATDAEDLITLSPAQFESSGMQTGQMADQVFSKAIKANGMIDVPPENQASVSAYFAGYVKDIRLLPGEKVAKGQLLFTLENPDYVGMQQDYLEAKGQLSYLKADYERQKTLAEDNVTSQKNFLKAESEYNVTMARFESLKKKLSLMNIDPGQVSEGNLRSTINIVAPISGYITGVNANKGMFLNPSDVAVTITHVDHVHLELNVFEKDIQLVKEGQLIRFNSVESGG